MSKDDTKGHIKPLSDYVLVQRKVKTTTAKGIILPESAQEKSKEATVLATGPGKANEYGIEPISVKIGETVLLSSYAGTEVKDGEEEYLLVREQDILGVIS
jgi:chaperonin GroES